MSELAINWVDLATKSHAENRVRISALNRRVAAYITGVADSIVEASDTDGQPSFSISDKSQNGCTIRADHGGTTINVTSTAILMRGEHQLCLSTDAGVLSKVLSFDSDDDLDAALKDTAVFVGLALATAAERH